MPENIIVGAGLAGCVAAINLAREGRDVLVLERESRIGGSPLYHPGIAGTPIDLKAYERYAGIDLLPGGKMGHDANVIVDGKKITLNMEKHVDGYLVEQGPRSSSINTYLYELAKKEGVKFEFNQAFNGSDDFAKLPPDTIIATGLYFEGYDSFNIPYLTSFHFIARMMREDVESNHVSIYFGDFTSDYAYTSSMNGIVFAHVFQRDPIGKSTLEAFKEKMFEAEGFEFPEWLHFTFPVPAASVHNPRLFSGNKIITGSLASCIEPFMFFGLHGAFVSGKIAAMAVSDKGKAYEEFLKCNRLFKTIFNAKKATKRFMYPAMHMGMMFGMDIFANLAINMPMTPMVSKRAKAIMPGYQCYAKQ
ncbi:MAG: NAD(P)-binding protein, partial [Actinobacteria bacterium]|nr:NAD(P)-binding protein [Actinomycetota bacterium]